MARDDLKLIIEAERKSANERIRKLEQEYTAALANLHEEHMRYKNKRSIHDWIWTIIFIAMIGLLVVALA